MDRPVRLHPDNPKLLEYRGRPVVLICASEHYGAVMNRPFRFEKYLADCAHKHQNYTRLFTLFRELQTDRNPYSTCKPESPDYVAPFRRVGPGTALDGQPLYDLDQWNPEFFDRLHRFLSGAEEIGVIVEIVLFSNTYCPEVWRLNPLNPGNNVNGTEELSHISEYLTRRHERMFHYQCRHARKIVEETRRYGNVIYELCNEPGGGGADSPEMAPVDEINAWLAAVAEIIRDAEADLPQKHLISGQESMAYVSSGPRQFADHSFDELPVDVVNMHPLTDMNLRGRRYDLGEFMMKELTLQSVRDYCLAAYLHESKPLNLDEDNTATQYKDLDGWTIHRKRAWVTVLCGCHYDFIDFSIMNYCEAGTRASRRHIRSWMSHLTRYVHSIDLVRARPLTDFVTGAPENVLPVAFGVAGSDYTVYLPDARELSDPAVGRSIGGSVTLDLPEGEYRYAAFGPRTGQYSSWTDLDASGATCIPLAPYKHDLSLRVRAKALPLP